MNQQFYRLEKRYNDKDLILIDQDLVGSLDPKKSEENLTMKGESLESLISSSSDLVFYTKYTHLTDYPVSEFGYQVVSEKFKNVIEKYIIEEVEFFEVEFESSKKIKEKYFLMNFINILSAMDRDNSDFIAISTGKILEIEKMVVNYFNLKDQVAFRLEEIKSVLIINNELKEAIEKAGITGVQFEELEKFKYPF